MYGKKSFWESVIWWNDLSWFCIGISVIALLWFALSRWKYLLYIPVVSGIIYSIYTLTNHLIEYWKYK